MTPGEEDKEASGEDCSSTRSDSHSEIDNSYNLPAAVDSPVDHDDKDSSSNEGDNLVNVNDDTNVHINNNMNKVCGGDSLRETKSDDESESFETLQIQKNLPPCVNIGNYTGSDKDHDEGITTESIPKEQQQDQMGIITNPGVVADPKQLLSTNNTNHSCTIVCGVGKDGITPSVGRGSGDDDPKKIGTPTPCQNTSSKDAPVLEFFVGKSSLSRKSRSNKKPSYISNLDDNESPPPPSNHNGSSIQKKNRKENPSYISYLDDNESPPPSNNNNNNNTKNLGPTTGQNTSTTDAPVLFVGQSSSAMKSCPLPLDFQPMAMLNPQNNNEVVPPQDEGPGAYSPNYNNNPLPADFEPMAMPNPPINNEGVLPQDEGPGAYSATPGSGLQRLDELDLSLVGVQPELSDQDEMIHQRRRYQQDDDGDGDSEPVHGLELVEQPEQQLPNLDGSSNLGELSRALPVGSSSFYNALKRRTTAKPVNQLELDQATAREAKEKKYKRIACGILALACVVLMVSLAVRFNKKDNSTSTVQDNQTPTPSPTSPSPSPTSPLPPMEHLELLYDELPEKTKESLSNRDSSQYQAWEWVRNHPNISSYPEWRKKQVFAMATFFHSFEGENWPQETSNRDRWMDVTTSECSWIANTFDNTIFYQATADRIGRDAYKEHDWQACNENGEIQTLSVNHLYLQDNLKPSIPPEIGLLSGLRILAFFQGIISARLSDFLVPDLIQLPNLQCLIFRDLGLSGSIPTSLGLFTGLRHLSILHNQITGSIPSEIGRMTSLEYFNVADDRSLTGELPSEVGLMTRLKGLEIYRSSLSGTIPTQLGWLNRLTTIFFDGNILMRGTIPSELGLLTSNTWLALYSNRLTGSLPTELGLMTSTKRLRIWNNALTGTIPSELGSMTNIVHFRVGNDLTLDGPRNDFDGSLPPKLWELSDMEELFLPNLPNLYGKIPSVIMMPNLTMLSLSGSPHVSGKIPDQVCLFVDELDFDCGDLLCGCDCQCTVSINETNFD